MAKEIVAQPELIVIHEEGVFSSSIRDSVNLNFAIVDISRPRQAPEGFSSSSRGLQGQICYDADNLYICTEDDVWKKVALEPMTITRKGK